MANNAFINRHKKGRPISYQHLLKVPISGIKIKLTFKIDDFSVKIRKGNPNSVWVDGKVTSQLIVILHQTPLELHHCKWQRKRGTMLLMKELHLSSTS